MEGIWSQAGVVKGIASLTGSGAYSTKSALLRTMGWVLGFADAPGRLIHGGEGHLLLAEFNFGL